MTCCPTEKDRKPIKSVVSGGLTFLKVDTAKNELCIKACCVTS